MTVSNSYYKEPNDIMINEQCIWKDVEGSSCGPIKVLSQNLPGQTKENHEKSKSR